MHSDVSTEDGQIACANHDGTASSSSSLTTHPTSSSSIQKASRSSAVKKYEQIKQEQLLQESAVRIEREKQLIQLDKKLYDERLASEKAQRRKHEAEAEIAELELKLRYDHLKKK